MTHVLVIDDDNSVRIATEALLQGHDCTVVLADNGRQGIQIFEESRFDVVLVDIFMPGMDGLETIKCFRERAPAMPIIAMSGFRFRNFGMAPAPDFLGMATKLGATYCLQKPFNLTQLMAAINVSLSAQGSIRRMVRRAQ